MRHRVAETIEQLTGGARVSKRSKRHAGAGDAICSSSAVMFAGISAHVPPAP
jgi:hypothetical protein